MDPIDSAGDFDDADEKLIDAAIVWLAQSLDGAIHQTPIQKKQTKKQKIIIKKKVIR